MLRLPPRKLVWRVAVPAGVVTESSQRAYYKWYSDSRYRCDNRQTGPVRSSSVPVDSASAPSAATQRECIRDMTSDRTPKGAVLSPEAAEDGQFETEPTVWLDLVSPSHPFFFRALVDDIPAHSLRTTVREKTETVGLAADAGFDYDVVGRDFDNPLLRKVGIPLRTGQLAMAAPTADVSLSSRNAMCILASKARGIPSIHFTDNDITAHVDGLTFEKAYNRLEAMATYNVVPAAFETAELRKRGASRQSIHTYDGYKEDIYVAAFEPDPDFLDQLPFEEYIVIRPEALDAAYVDTEQSLAPALLAGAVARDINVVYLPRGRGDESYATPYDETDVYTPEEPLNGLDLAWHANCVLTGSGTMAREAACMNKPAVSFFPNTLLSVDQELVEDGRILHSRDPTTILDYVESLSVREMSPDRSRSRTVRTAVTKLVTSLLDEASSS